MRILFTTTGHVGHTLPLVPLAAAFRRAGHDVHVAAPTTKLVNAAALGVPVRPFAPPSPAASEQALARVAPLTPQAAEPTVVGDLFGRAAGGVAAPALLATTAALQPDLIVRETYEMAGAVAAAAAGIPHVRVALSLADHESDILAYAYDAVADVARANGVDPLTAADGLLAAPSVGYVPRNLDIEAPARPSLRIHTPMSGREAPDPWPGGDGPLVFVSLGTVAGNLPLFPEVFTRVIAQLGRVDARFLLAVGREADVTQLGPLPPNVRVEGWVDQQAVLAYASAVLFHGGHGTMLSALRHGLPSVVLPLFSLDQWRNAARLEELGAGVALTGPRRRAFEPPSAELLAELPAALRHVLDDPGPRAVARWIAADMAALPPADPVAARLVREEAIA